MATSHGSQTTCTRVISPDQRRHDTRRDLSGWGAFATSGAHLCRGRRTPLSSADDRRGFRGRNACTASIPVESTTVSRPGSLQYPRLRRPTVVSARQEGAATCSGRHLAGDTHRSVRVMFRLSRSLGARAAIPRPESHRAATESGLSTAPRRPLPSPGVAVPHDSSWSRTHRPRATQHGTARHGTARQAWRALHALACKAEAREGSVPSRARAVWNQVKRAADPGRPVP